MERKIKMKKCIAIIAAVMTLLSFSSCEVSYNGDDVRTFELKGGEESSIRPYPSGDEYFEISIDSIDKSFEYYGGGTDTRHADILHHFVVFKINVQFNGTGGTAEVNGLGEKNGDIVAFLDYSYVTLCAYVNGSINKMNNIEVIKRVNTYLTDCQALRPGDSGKIELHVKTPSEGFDNYPCYLEFKYEDGYMSAAYVPLNFDPNVYTEFPLSK